MAGDDRITGSGKELFEILREIDGYTARGEVAPEELRDRGRALADAVLDDNAVEAEHDVSNDPVVDRIDDAVGRGEGSVERDES